MKLSENINMRRVDAYGRGENAVISVARLDNWATASRELETQGDRARGWAFTLGACCVGLLFGLMYAGVRLSQPVECAAPTSELTGDPEVMHLAPMQIRPERLTAKGVITL